MTNMAKNVPQSFEQQLRNQLEAVVRNIDEDTERELQNARRRALAHRRQPQAKTLSMWQLWRQPMWAGAAATVAVGVFAAWMVFNRGPGVGASSMPVFGDDFEMIMAMELGDAGADDWEFYAWLSQLELDELEQFERMGAF